MSCNETFLMERLHESSSCMDGGSEGGKRKEGRMKGMEFSVGILGGMEI